MEHTQNFEGKICVITMNRRDSLGKIKTHLHPDTKQLLLRSLFFDNSSASGQGT